MRHALALSLAALLLGGCASHENVDPNGVWINQKAIDAAAKGASLRQALLANGPTLEWSIDTVAGQARFSNGFEEGEGKLVPQADGQFKVDFYGNGEDTLKIDGDTLQQAASDNAPVQTFSKSATPARADTPVGATFEQALYTAYMGGDWKVVEGPGQGGVAHFLPDGRIDGLAGLDRYALCLAGDCAAMSGEFDSMWLEQQQRGNAFIFRRKGNQLEILQALNQAQDDEMPNLVPGTRRWLLSK
ncbi:hypothetical protein [Pseudomonas coleopterorum]|uniref:Lipoprotein n=1 Tax=Pseudomonas coleopterorum TaxID=1605838 RepID=A0AAJ6M0J4_9PSED|nr:hypothetical protein [Pseudomonas coleopterorum]WNC10041.1 hypothetical protein RI108_01015 [Pseudomonas coleopterorum]SEE74724.1 hypothetical protein SAMN05216510_4172 [Pseudomonas coleopterorum]